MSQVLNRTKLSKLSTGKHASLRFVYMPYRFVNFFSGEGLTGLGLGRSTDGDEGFLMNGLGSPQRHADIFTNVLGSHMPVESRFAHQSFRLWSGAANKHRATAFLQLVGEFLQSGDSRGVDCRHIAQAQNHDRRQVSEVVRDGGDFVGYAE